MNSVVAGPGVTLVSGVLTITGTNGNDWVEVERVGNQYRVKANFLTGSGVYFNVNSVQSILVNVLDGNDDVEIGSTVLIPATLNGGDGNDELSGGNGANTINGGAGNDEITGGSANDIIYAGIGNKMTKSKVNPETMSFTAATETMKSKGVPETTCCSVKQATMNSKAMTETTSYPEVRATTNWKGTTAVTC